MSIGPIYRCLLEVARERGVDTRAILAEYGFTEESMLSPDARLAPEVGRALAARLVLETGDAELGLRAAERFKLSDLDLLGYMAWHSTSLPAMFDTMSQYARLLGDSAHCEVRHGAGSLTVSFTRTGGRLFLPEAADFFVGLVARLVTEWSSGGVRLIAVQLPRGTPRHPLHYERFFGVPVEFGAAAGALTYEHPSTSAARADRDPALGEILRRQADRALLALPSDASLRERAREQLGQQLERGEPSLGGIAEGLGVSERTLRRRLREAGSGYRELLDEVRRERALMLAHEGVHSVTHMAMLVGFADVTTFTRAFRRWTGSLPSEYLGRERIKGLAD